MSAAPQIPFNVIAYEPTLTDAFSLLSKNIMLDFNCHHVGTVEIFDSAKQTARVTINYTKTYFELDPATKNFLPVQVNYAPLIDCPVIFLGGGKSSLTFPVVQGDECLVLFNDRDLNAWLQSGQVGPCESTRLHAFSDAIILVGLRSSQKVLQSFDPTRAVLQNDQAMVGVGPSLIKVANNLFTLNTLLQELISDVQNLVSATAAITVFVSSAPGTSGPPLNAGAITAAGTALTATAMKIGQLLE